jgi:Tat protein translocase TatB subunit
MFGFSFGEVLLIAVIALIALGPKQLPEVARSLGRLLNELRRAGGDFQRTFLDANEVSQKTLQGLQQSIQERLDAKINAAPAPNLPASDGHHHLSEAAEFPEDQLSFELGASSSAVAKEMASPDEPSKTESPKKES